jgi:hypothetical protein
MAVVRWKKVNGEKGAPSSINEGNRSVTQRRAKEVQNNLSKKETT